MGFWYFAHEKSWGVGRSVQMRCFMRTDDFMHFMRTDVGLVLLLCSSDFVRHGMGGSEVGLGFADDDTR